MSHTSVKRGTIVLITAMLAVGLTVRSAQAQGSTDTVKKVTKKTVTSTIRVPLSKSKVGTTTTTTTSTSTVDQTVPAYTPPLLPDTAAIRMRNDSIARDAERQRFADMERARRDSIAAAQRARDAYNESIMLEGKRISDSIAMATKFKQDSAAAADAEARREMGSGLYIGLGGGASVPTSDFHSNYSAGYNITVPVGYDIADTPFGVRIDGGYDHADGRVFQGFSTSSVGVWSLNADLKVRFQLPGGWPFEQLYFLAGGTMNRVVANGGVTPPAGGQPSGVSSNGFATTLSDAPSNYGWNAGAGLSFFKLQHASLFLETRYFSVAARDASPAPSAHFYPVILGVEFR